MFWKTLCAKQKNLWVVISRSYWLPRLQGLWNQRLRELFPSPPSTLLSDWQPLHLAEVWPQGGTQSGWSRSTPSRRGSRTYSMTQAICGLGIILFLKWFHGFILWPPIQQIVIISTEGQFYVRWYTGSFLLNSQNSEK